MRLDVADLPCGDSDYVTELHIVVDPGGKRVEGEVVDDGLTKSQWEDCI